MDFIAMISLDNRIICLILRHVVGINPAARQLLEYINYIWVNENRFILRFDRSSIKTEQFQRLTFPLSIHQIPMKLLWSNRYAKVSSSLYINLLFAKRKAFRRNRNSMFPVTMLMTTTRNLVKCLAYSYPAYRISKWNNLKTPFSQIKSNNCRPIGGCPAEVKLHEDRPREDSPREDRPREDRPREDRPEEDRPTN